MRAPLSLLLTACLFPATAVAANQTSVERALPAARPLAMPPSFQIPAAFGSLNVGDAGLSGLALQSGLSLAAPNQSASGTQATAAVAVRTSPAGETLSRLTPQTESTPASIGQELGRISEQAADSIQGAGELSRAGDGDARGLGERLELLLTGRPFRARAADLAAPSASAMGGLGEMRLSPSRAPGKRGPDGPSDVGPSGSGSGGSGRGAARRAVLSRVYGWMTLGLALTGAAAWVMKATGAVLTVAHSPALMIALAVAELGLVLVLAAGLRRMSPGAAIGGFFAYAALTGVSLSPIFLAYTTTSIAAAFLVSAGMFGAMALFGHVTKRDLNAVGSYALMALIGIILASLANFFLRSPRLDVALTYLSVLVFVGLTAFDAQKIKKLADEIRADDAEGITKAAVLGALNLYLDFINLFIDLLKILGRRKSD